MNINERADKAIYFKRSGCNCCQAVAASCADLVEISQDNLISAASGFGAGMGCMEGDCGALIGAVMIAGLVTKGRSSTAAAKNIFMRFRQMCGATVCKDLKGITTGAVLCKCDDCVKNAVYALSEVLPEK